MKRILLLLMASLALQQVIAQNFADTAAVNQFIRENIRDKRPQKVSAQDLQTALLGVSKFTGGASYTPGNGIAIEGGAIKLGNINQPSAIFETVVTAYQKDELAVPHRIFSPETTQFVHADSVSGLSSALGITPATIEFSSTNATNSFSAILMPGELRISDGVQGVNPFRFFIDGRMTVGSFIPNGVTIPNEGFNQASLWLTESNKGFLPNRGTEAQRLALNPLPGLEYTQIDAGATGKGKYIYIDGDWQKLSTGGSGSGFDVTQPLGMLNKITIDKNFTETSSPDSLFSIRSTAGDYNGGNGQMWENTALYYGGYYWSSFMERKTPSYGYDPGTVKATNFTQRPEFIQLRSVASDEYGGSYMETNLSVEPFQGFAISNSDGVDFTVNSSLIYHRAAANGDAYHFDVSDGFIYERSITDANYNGQRYYHFKTDNDGFYHRKFEEQVYPEPIYNSDGIPNELKFSYGSIFASAVVQQSFLGYNRLGLDTMFSVTPQRAVIASEDFAVYSGYYDAPSSRAGQPSFRVKGGAAFITTSFIYDLKVDGRLRIPSIANGTITSSSYVDYNTASGRLVYDDNFLYIKTSTGYKRVALSTF